MKRVKPENVQLTSDFNSTPPKRFTSPHFYQQNLPHTFVPYMATNQNFLYGASPVAVPPPPAPPQQWSFKQHPPPKLFDPTQPPPSFPSQDLQKSSVPPPTLPQMSVPPPPLPIRGRGGGRGNFRGNFDRRIKHPSNTGSTNPGKSYVFTKKTPNPGTETNNQISPSVEIDSSDDTHGHSQPLTQVNKKSKRKSMSTRYTRAKEWDHDDAVKAINLEKEYNRLQRTPMLILKFPDPDLNKYIVKKYSSFIETVHFQQPSTPRYCFVQLKVGADLEKVRQELCEIPFGTGKIVAERKFQSTEESQSVTPEEIDPYTLYIGNLPTQISVKTVKEHFPKALRIDIGYAQRMKYTRYAFIRYSNVEDAMDAYKNTFNTLVANRSLIVRFRRAKGNIGLPGKTATSNPKKPAANPTDPIATTENEKSASKTPLESQPVTEENNELDNKVNVFEQAQRLALTSNITDESYDPTTNLLTNNVVIKSEPKDYFDPITDNIRDTNILGTRIKDEPFDDDELLAQAQCYDEDEMDEDDYDCEPEEEDDFEYNAQNSTRPESNVVSKPQENHQQLTVPNWEEIRKTELLQEDKKPDIDHLLAYTSNNNKTITSISDLFTTKKDKDKSILSNSCEKPDDLDELFNSMNPEDDDEYDF